MEQNLDELMRRYKNEIMRYAGQQIPIQSTNPLPMNRGPQNSNENMTTPMPPLPGSNSMNEIGMQNDSRSLPSPAVQPENGLRNTMTPNTIQRNNNSMMPEPVMRNSVMGNIPSNTDEMFRPVMPQQNNPDTVTMRARQQQGGSAGTTMPIMPQQPTMNSNENLARIPALNGNSDTGYMVVQVSALQGAVPIANADVVVTRDIGNEIYLMWYDVTDESGKSRIFELPAPPREMSEQPSNGGVPYASYNVRVAAPGFFTITNAGAQVFGGQTSIAAVDMIPKSESQMNTTENITYTTPPSGLLNS